MNIGRQDFRTHGTPSLSRLSSWKAHFFKVNFLFILFYFLLDFSFNNRFAKNNKSGLQKYNFSEFPPFPVSNVDNFSVIFLQIRRISHDKIQYYRHFRKEDAHLAFSYIVNNFFAAIALFHPISTRFPPDFSRNASPARLSALPDCTIHFEL